ncbi:MAG: M56 family metallopeptidase [Shewanella fodinae]|nr:M56 family metallopeptidase [Shewanella fodinae]
MEQFNFASWHTFTLVVAGAYLTWSLAKSVHASTRQFSALSDLLGLTTEPEIKNSENVSYYMIANTISYCVHFRSITPQSLLTTALTQQVTARELAIIVSHETAHVKARDPLFKFIFAIFANVFPSSTAINLRNQYTLLTEQMADHAVTNVHDRFDVAQALINIVRLQSRNSHIASTTASYFGEDQISKRVNYLIAPDLTRSHWAITMTLLLLSVLPWVTASGVDSLHHLIETIFTH